MGVPEGIRIELTARARHCAVTDGLLRATFETCEQANEAIDLLRSKKCEVESLARVRSSLEEVFMRTVEAHSGVTQ